MDIKKFDLDNWEVEWWYIGYIFSKLLVLVSDVYNLKWIINDFLF